jgi:hypothetical protein
MVNKEQINLLLFVLYIVVILGVLLFVFNQAINIIAKEKLLINPCEACKEIAKERSACIDNCLIVKRTLYPQPNGDLKDSFGNCFNNKGEKITCKDNPFNLSITAE